MDSNNIRIAIDGPASAGKSTVAKMIAKKLGIIYVDTGAMYRAVAVYLLCNSIDYNNEAAVTAALKDIEVTIRYADEEQLVTVNGENVTGSLRTEQVGHVASVTSAYPAVRKHLLSMQQKLAAEQSVVMDGRDIGTCVIPDAELKIFLTASLDERVTRRYWELTKKGMEPSVAAVKKDMAERDYRDSHRETAPLKQAEDAILIDSTDMTKEDVCEAVISELKRKTDLFPCFCKQYKVIEDNGGGLTLVVFDDQGKVEYLHSGYEYWPGQLTRDLNLLKEGCDPKREWDGNDEYAQEVYDNITSFECGWEIIADNDGIYPDKMGSSGKLEFKGKENA